MSKRMDKERVVELRLDGTEPQWTYVGDPEWKYDAQGLIYPPVWPQAELAYYTVVSAYSYDQAREDYAFFTGATFADMTLSVEFKMYHSSIVHGGLVFRAMDRARCYVVDVVDMGRRGQTYNVTLWVQDETGYRRELAGALAPHSTVDEDIYQLGPGNTEQWFNSSPEWAKLEVRAAGSHIEVALDGETLFAVEDDTCPAGCIGLVARGPILFRGLQVKGNECALSEPWMKHEGPLPRFFYPGGKQPKGFNAFPVVAARGETVFVAWAHGCHAFQPTATLLTRSDDGGRTWTPPQPISLPLIGERGGGTGVSSLFIHDDATLRCGYGGIVTHEERDFGFFLSADSGATWSGPLAFQPGGRNFSDYGQLRPYSPIIRLSDGTLVMAWKHESDPIPGGSAERNDQRRSRSVLFRSTDDGRTWSAPIYFDKENFDCNECMVAETAPGKLVAFMRTLRAPHMWTGTSNDGGLTWTKLVESNVSGDCPYLLAHSSGALILFSRGAGAFIKLSFDQGRSWTGQCRISPAAAMAGMAELSDGTILIAMHEGYRVGQYIRGQRFRVTAQGPVPAH